jgi:general secretion pathway protein A
MFLDYFKLAEEPFGVTPDPRFLYLGPKHREALASLAYGTESNRGFLALIAKPGMGKTSLLYQYLEGLRGKARTAFVFRTDCYSREFIRHILIDLGIDVTGKDLPAMHEALNQVLAEEMRAGRRFVLVIDEAQNLEEKVLESIRLLSNFETPRMKLMQIVIAGQPGLAEKLNRPSMTQLRQRISLVIHIAPLNREEINAYIDHRLWVAGCKISGLFTVGARKLIAEHSEGIPRKINNICFNAMSLACALKRNSIGRATLLEVLADLDLDPLIEKPSAVTEAPEARPIQVTSTPQQFTERKREWFQCWVPRFAVGGALVLAMVTGINTGEVQMGNIAGRVDKPVVLQLPTSTQIPTNTMVIAPSPRQMPGAVRIPLGQSLYHISVENLGRHDPQILEGIRDLNPWRNNPDHIRAGQKILMHSEPKSTSEGQAPTLQKDPSFPQEVGKE